MNYKLLFPTYRTRQRWVLGAVDELAAQRGLRELLNVGCGEGDFDRALKARCEKLVSVDANAEDVAYARQLNATTEGLEYDVQDATSLAYGDARFDAITCLDVIEHVTDPCALMLELARVLKPGGSIVLTCPSARFPITYDPLNWALAPFEKHLSFGAFGYGHSWLVREVDLLDWARQAGLEVVRFDRLSKALASLLECYWPGIAQRVLKANAGNRANAKAQRQPRFTLRPSQGEHPLVALADLIIDLDARLFASSKESVGLGIYLRKPAAPVARVT